MAQQRPVRATLEIGYRGPLAVLVELAAEVDASEFLDRRLMSLTGFSYATLDVSVCRGVDLTEGLAALSAFHTAAGDKLA